MKKKNSNPGTTQLIFVPSRRGKGVFYKQSETLKTVIIAELHNKLIFSDGQISSKHIIKFLVMNHWKAYYL